MEQIEEIIKIVTAKGNPEIYCNDEKDASIGMAKALTYFGHKQIWKRDMQSISKIKAQSWAEAIKPTEKKKRKIENYHRFTTIYGMR